MYTKLYLGLFIFGISFLGLVHSFLGADAKENKWRDDDEEAEEMESAFEWNV